MQERIEISELTREQREAACSALDAMATRLPLTCIEVICRALATHEVLIDYDAQGVPRGCSILADTKLSRTDLVEAAALDLRLREALGEDAADHTIDFLGQRGAALSIVLRSSLALYRRGIRRAMERMKEFAQHVIN